MTEGIDPIRVCICGENGVGKRSLAQAMAMVYRSICGGFSRSGRDANLFEHMTAEISRDTDDSLETTREIAAECDIILIVIDLLNRETFVNAEARLAACQRSGAKIAIIGNKSERVRDRKVKNEEALEFAHKNSCLYFETSKITRAGIVSILNLCLHFPKVLEMAQTLNTSLEVAAAVFLHPDLFIERHSNDELKYEDNKSRNVYMYCPIPQDKRLRDDCVKLIGIRNDLLMEFKGIIWCEQTKKYGFLVQYIEGAKMSLQEKFYLSEKRDDLTSMMILYGIAFGMKRLSDLGIIHGRMNPWLVKLRDMREPVIVPSLVAEVVNDEYVENNLPYLAPEVLDVAKGIQRNEKSDVYAFGSIMYHILFSDIPDIMTRGNLFSTLAGIKSKIIHGKKSRIPSDKSIPQGLKSLILKCWNANSERPSFSEILRELADQGNDWLRDADVDSFGKYVRRLDEQDSSGVVYTAESHQAKRTASQQFTSDTNLLSSIYMRFMLPRSSNVYVEPCYELDQSKLDDLEKNASIIGKGGNGTISLAFLSNLHSPACCDPVVIKMVDRDGLNEKDIMRSVRHPCILKVLDVNILDEKRSSDRIFLEYARNGSLDKHLGKCPDDFGCPWLTSTNKMLILVGIILGMRYVHQHSIMHRDLKPSNILLDENYLVRICDFGTACPNYGDDSRVKGIGTKGYQAPEIQAKASDDIEYDNKVDVYSFGMLMCELLNGYMRNDPPMNGIPHMSASIMPRAKDLINRCIHEDPEQRPSFDELAGFLNACNFNIISGVDSSLVRSYYNAILDWEHHCV